jgi:hypothetical protein
MSEARRKASRWVRRCAPCLVPEARAERLSKGAAVGAFGTDLANVVYHHHSTIRGDPRRWTSTW